MQRIPGEQVAAFLGQTALFRGCPPALLGKLAPHLEQRQMGSGQVLLSPGTLVAALGLLHKGRASLRLHNAASGTDTVLEELLPGECFGEIALMLGGATPLAVRAEEPCEALYLRKEHFEQVLGAVPSVAQAVARQVSARFVKMGVLGARPGAAPQAVPDAAPGPVRKGEARFVETASFSIGSDALDLVPTRLIVQHRLLPLELRGKRLLVGMVNPFSIDALQDLKRVLVGIEPEAVAISIDDWQQMVTRLKLDLGGTPQAGGRGMPRISYLAEARKEADKAQIIIGDEVISLLDRILMEGVERGASDVHIEPEFAGVKVRYRVQGVLFDRKEVIPASFATALVARTKILAELDITERRLPQDGRIVGQVGKKELNFRVSTLPTSRGEKAVIRIIDPVDVMRPPDQIFLDAQVAQAVLEAVSMSHGAILVAGPSGSGKSSTLYSLLHQRKASRPDNNIVTVEDPVEYSCPGMTQVSINPKVGLEYGTVLQGLMRQDPDVIMIGELRDAAIANITIEAALTGHLVLTSMHGSNVMTVLQRLEHIGCNFVLLAQALNAIIVQRLARRLCPSCVREEEIPGALLEILLERGIVARGSSTRMPRSVGCEACDRTGYRGRIALVELLTFNDELRGPLGKSKSATDFMHVASQSKHFVSFERSVRLAIARKLVSPADALLVVAT